MKIVALVTEPESIARYLRHLGAPVDPPSLSPARGPPYYQRRVLRRRPSPRIEDVVITIRKGRVLVPLPEGNEYLGFAFARGEDPAAVERALRAAHACLSFDFARTVVAGAVRP